jgi:hypothetical protein
MPTTTPVLGLTKPDIGSTDWGNSVNTNWDSIDDAFNRRKQMNIYEDLLLRLAVRVLLLLAQLRVP